MSEKRIVARNLCKSFGGKQVVDDVSLEVREGEIYGLVGPDGAGKTTLIRLLCGALRPDKGEVIVGGYSMANDPDKAREQVGYLSQRFSLYEELTVIENLRFFAEVRGLSRTEWYPRSMEILEFVGLAQFSERRAGHLSGGMKQKLGLATALVHRPQVLLLDEPTGGVDPVTRQDFWQLIIRLVTEENVSVLVSTPYMDEAVRCTYVGFMRQGKIMIEDHPKTLRQSLDGRILTLVGKPFRRVRDIALQDPAVEDAQIFGDRLHLRVAKGSTSQVIRRLKRAIPRQGGDILRIYPSEPQLEDVFIALLPHSSLDEEHRLEEDSHV